MGDTLSPIELRFRLSSIEARIRELESRIFELEFAERLLKSRPRRVYLMLGGRLLVEASVEEALSAIRGEVEALRVMVERLRREAEELRRRLESSLG